MLRRVRTRIAAGLDDDIGQAKDRRPYGQGGKRAAGKLRGEELKNDVFGEAQQIGLRPFAFAGAILGDRAEQHAHAVAAGFFHRAVNRARCFFRGKTARAFKRRSQPCQEPQARHEVVKVWRLDGGIGRLSRGMPTISYERGNETCQHRVHPALRLRINGNAFHVVLQKSRRPPGIVPTVRRLFRS